MQETHLYIKGKRLLMVGKIILNCTREEYVTKGLS